MGLQIGCGDRHWRGWVNLDLSERVAPALRADVRALPFGDGHFSAVCAIHVLEHLYPWDAPVALKEWRRVLAPAGTLTIELPNMDIVWTYVADCVSHRRTPDPRWSWFAIYGDSQRLDPAMMHRWGYTQLMAVHALQDAGFTDVQVARPRYHVPMRDMRLVATR